MKSVFFFLTVFLLNVFTGCKSPSDLSEVKVEYFTDGNGFKYETVRNDPTGLRLYTLENGLKVYLSQNFDEPKIQTYVAVRAGSVYDPADNTGLAHYLEHMIFKGTDEIGTTNWKKEQALLNQISGLYEKHKAEKNADAKKGIYNEIDMISQEASKLCIANEYDKMIASLGAEGTNAWTSVEETVYTNKIPSNELQKWLKVESERFSQVVLRLFHTELEAVYEEFNTTQDSDFTRLYYAMSDKLFPKHPYGQQTTIGESEHLKNPSMVAINNYFDTYYVPNNMALVLVGDLQFDNTIKMIDEAFGGYKPKEVPVPKLPVEEPLDKAIAVNVFGPEAERINLTFRTGGLGSEDHKYVTLIDMILSNSDAGLIDLNLNQKQRVQTAGCSPYFYNDYGLHIFYGVPRAGQSLDEVKELILEQIEKVKKGDFDAWLPQAVINDLELRQTRRFENASALANQYVDAFIGFQDWKTRVTFYDELRKISKEDLLAFANKFYKENYVVGYKLQGKTKTLVKVENPAITPIVLNRDKKSKYIKNFNKITSPGLKPQFVNYKEAIKKRTSRNGLEISFVENKTNDLFELSIIFDLGKDNDKKLALAAGYLDYVGTDRYSPEELKKEFYKIGISYYVNSQADRSYVGISGLRENMEQGFKLLEHLWTHAKADQSTYDKYVAQIGKAREDNKFRKRNIMWQGLFNYGKYGANSPLRDIFSIEELEAIKPAELIEIIKELRTYNQRIFYYGTDVKDALACVDNDYNIPQQLIDHPEAISYEHQQTGGKVYFVDYDMVQSEFLFMAKGDHFDPENLAAATLFNSYFGDAGLSSIVFQEIRESKSLAYSAFSSYSAARKKLDPDYVYAYVGTQANKLSLALEAMMELMTEMPEAEAQFKAAKEAALKKIASERITKANLFWSYERLKKRGIDNDNRESIYNEIKEMTLDDLKVFFNKNIRDRDYTVLVMGSKDDLDFKALRKLGDIEELEVDFLFNYHLPKKQELKASLN